MNFDNDLELYLKDFGEDVVFTLENNQTLSIKAIFDNAYFLAELGEIDLNTIQPRITCIHSQISQVQQKNSVLIRNKNYKVIKVQPDGTGMATVALGKQKNSVLIRNKNYKVIKVQPDGTGMATVALGKQKNSVLIRNKNYKVNQIQPDGTGMATVVLA